MATTYPHLQHSSSNARLATPAGPPRPNLLSAALYISALLATHGIPHAAMGGFAMLCRGSRRATLDVDFAVNASMRDLWRVVGGEVRYVFNRSPEQVNFLGVSSPGFSLGGLLWCRFVLLGISPRVGWAREKGSTSMLGFFLQTELVG